jgi:peptidoglycan/xylan/chitin deacetylase (PgdA/CDA1 family)
MLSSLIKLSGKKLLLPLYHAVSDVDLKHIKNLYSIRNTKQFVQDIDFILKYFHPIDVETLLDSIENKKEITKNSVLFTFDDGLKEAHEIIAPILKQKGVSAVFFVNSDFVDNKNMFYRFKASLLVEKIKSLKLNENTILEISAKFIEKPKTENEICRFILQIEYHNKFLLDEIAKMLNFSFDEFIEDNQPYLTTAQIRYLIDQGFYVGAHSIDHPEYIKIPYDEQLKQTLESIHWIKSNFKQKHNLFAFPFTDYRISGKFFNTIYASEKPLVDLSFGCAGLKDELYPKHLQRLPIEKSKQLAKQIIRNEYLAYIGKKLIGKNAIKRS